MQLSRPVVALAGAALLGLAAVGVGASATFTAATTSDQTITAGTLGFSIYSAGLTDCNDAGDHCTSLTLPDVGPVNSTFETMPTQVRVQNTGNIPLTFDSLQLSASTNNSAKSNALESQMNVCIRMHDTPGQPTWVEGNGPLAAAVALNPTVKENPVALQPGDTATYWVSFYAGQDSSECGTIYSDGTHTKNAWAAYLGHGYQTPDSLTNAAMGGSVKTTLQFNVTA